MPLSSEVRAVCGSAASTDLGGGRLARAVPTANNRRPAQPKLKRGCVRRSAVMLLGTDAMQLAAAGEVRSVCQRSGLRGTMRSIRRITLADPNRRARAYVLLSLSTSRNCVPRRRPFQCIGRCVAR